MKINPAISASAISRYEKVIRRQSADVQGMSTTDKVELSEQAKLYSSLIQAAQNSEDFSSDKVHAVMNKIASGNYHVNIGQLAEKMMSGIDGTNGGETDE